MEKKILVNFIKDKLNFTIGYFLNTILILLYVYLLCTQIDLLYPLLLSIILYLFIILNEWTRYYKFNRNLNEGIENRYFNLNFKTNEQKEASRAILKIHENYTNKISSIYAQNTKNKYFLSQWIHNIKTPVSIIDLIIQKATKDANFNSNELNILKLFFDIKQENNKVRNGLEQVLNISRLSDFSKDYSPETLNLVSLLREVINSKKSNFIYNNIFPKIDFKYEKALIITDKKWNKFILEQIISNAIKYSAINKEKKYIYFNIYINHKETKLIIRDEGIGIPSYDIKRIFEPFFTGENGRKVNDATGIGLYICKLISQKLNHTILVESEFNKGTTVSIIYPSKI
ncbi:sensor histidine kinase [Clostridium scatologenes]|uniref:histidine kinase n=1 Tax=Clostridium scatologenes TaxID=1548 RepID=A0A0E3GQ89_CLOSL|nr:sensor histidine kinase [Clostridium scatologenes]AKA68151.1 sensory transduction histidine kinase [Clostridium scatologenes]